MESIGSVTMAMLTEEMLSSLLAAMLTASETWSFTEARLVPFPSGLVTTVVLLQDDDDDDNEDEDEEEEEEEEDPVLLVSSQYWWNALPNKQSRHANRSHFTIFIDASAAISIPA
jgi:hypothetical protein